MAEMESLSETTWDAVICGTGLLQSLLALSLSRSDKKILHLDPNEYYGGPDAAFSLQEAEDWAARDEGNAASATDHSTSSSVFSSASAEKAPDVDGLSFSRAYSLALSPQIIHTRSALLSQLVSSRAFRQIDFLAVGSFFIFKPAASSGGSGPSLARIPSTREDVFSSGEISARSKRLLMKFLRSVIDQEANQSQETLQQQQQAGDEPLTEYLQREFKLDEDLQAYILTLTLALGGGSQGLSARDGVAAIRRHLSSMGVFGPGFAAVYPKWGGTSEIAQVACRAGAVGGTVYILGTGINKVKPISVDTDGTEKEEQLELELTSDVTVRTRMLFRGDATSSDDGGRISRLVAIVGSPFPTLYETVVEGAPTATVAVVAFPPGSITGHDGLPSVNPVYVTVHSSDTGECPAKQSILYLTTLAGPESKSVLENSLQALLRALRGAGSSGMDEAAPAPACLYRLYYEQARGSTKARVEGRIFYFPAPPLSLAFDDSALDPVRRAWEMAVGPGSEAEYMAFSDRDGVQDDDDDDAY